MNFCFFDNISSYQENALLTSEYIYNNVPHRNKLLNDIHHWWGEQRLKCTNDMSNYHMVYTMSNGTSVEFLELSLIIQAIKL